VQARAGNLFKKRLPIHLASTNINSQDSLIQKLNQLHPRGASIPDGDGKLPFHLACEIGKDWETGGVGCTYESFPNAIRQPESNSRGWLPLHMVSACRRSTSFLIEKLVELYPEAAHVPDREGQFPLHLACGAGKSWEGGLKVLFEANASALTTYDKKQQVPFYIAAYLYCRGNPSNRSTPIAEVKPIPSVAALKEKTVNSEEAAELDILYQLLRSDPSIVLSFTS
jgi:ankyrin repeat protein